MGPPLKARKFEANLEYENVKEKSERPLRAGTARNKCLKQASVRTDHIYNFCMVAKIFKAATSLLIFSTTRPSLAQQ